MKLKMTVGLAAIALVASSVAAVAYPTQTTGATYLHTGPGANYSLVTPVPAGANVNVQHCIASWCRVVWTQYVGFMPAGLLAQVPYSNPPTFTPAPVGGDTPYPLDCDPYYDSTCAVYDYGYPYGVYGRRGRHFGHGGHFNHGSGGAGNTPVSPGFASPGFASPGGAHSFGGGNSFGGGHSFGGGNSFGGSHGFAPGGNIWRP